MNQALDRVEFLRARNTRVGVTHALWDLRDLAYDHPEIWQRFTAELLFQALAEQADRAPDDAINWAAFSSFVGDALQAAVEWSRSGTT